MKAMHQIHVRHLAEASAAYILDVREEHEFVTGHIPGAVNLPMSVLPARYHELPADRTVYLVCEVGARSGQATQALAAAGWDVVNVAGGTQAWIRAGFGLED
jgi:rhodanese-related sulfurtransferase